MNRAVRFPVLILISVLLFFYALGSFAAGDSVAAEKTPVVYTSSNFTFPSTVQEGTLIFFYAPWCGHCDKFKPVYARLASEYVSKNGAASPVELLFAKVDATVETELANRFGVHSYPSLVYLPGTGKESKIANDGPYVVHKGENTFDGVSRFLDWQAHSFSLIELETQASYDTFANELNEALVVVLFIGGETKTESNFREIYPVVSADELIRNKFAYFGKAPLSASFSPTKCDADCLLVYNKVTGLRKTLIASSPKVALSKEDMSKFVVGVGSLLDPYSPALLSRCQVNSAVKRFALVVESVDAAEESGLLTAIADIVVGSHLGEIGVVRIDPVENAAVLENYR